ncbi:MAG TPA: LecA/PA-IL family lectin [Blastocatellia bacterium]|nr:LecA/PA-IL family lectin [Blastocatellia bacterium]
MRNRLLLALVIFLFTSFTLSLRQHAEPHKFLAEPSKDSDLAIYPTSLSAFEVANRFWDSQMIRCGDSYYYFLDEIYVGQAIYQGKNRTIEVNVTPARPLTEAERLNGMVQKEWEGFIKARFSAERRKRVVQSDATGQIAAIPNPTWERWMDNGWLVAAIVKYAGKPWRVFKCIGTGGGSSIGKSMPADICFARTKRITCSEINSAPVKQNPQPQPESQPRSEPSIVVTNPSKITKLGPNRWKVQLAASENWYDTKIQVQPTDIITISAEGSIIWDSSLPPVGPDGTAYEAETLPNPSRFPLPWAKCGSLIMKVGEGGYTAGSSKTITVQDSGTIQLMINDAVEGLSDNRGNFIITIRKQPAPMSSHSASDSESARPQPPEKPRISTPTNKPRGISGTNRLNVPFKAQVPPGTWAETNNCGQTCVLMVISYYKKTVPTVADIKALDDWCTERFRDAKGNYNGVAKNVSQLEIIAREYGAFVNSVAYYHWTLDDLHKELSLGHPVIVPCWTDMLVDPPHRRHFMVLIGIDDNYVYVNDPGHSAERGGANHRYSISQFKKAWESQSSAVVLIHPPE